MLIIVFHLPVSGDSSVRVVSGTPEIKTVSWRAEMKSRLPGVPDDDVVRIQSILD